MSNSQPIIELIGNFLGTLVAAFFGAWAAFKYENSARNKQQEDDQVAAGNRALFTLMVIWNTLKQYQKEYVDQRRGKIDAWLNLAAGSPLGHDDLAFDVKDLSFLLQSKGSIFQTIFSEADRFHTAINHIRQRSEIVLAQVFPSLAAAGIKINEQRPVNEIEDVLGIDVVHKLKVLTDGIIKNVDENVNSSREAIETLRSTLVTLFPKRKFIRIDFEPPPVNTAPLAEKR